LGKGAVKEEDIRIKRVQFNVGPISISKTSQNERIHFKHQLLEDFQPVRKGKLEIKANGKDKTNAMRLYPFNQVL
jgi:hypothetical protein